MDANKGDSFEARPAGGLGFPNGRRDVLFGPDALGVVAVEGEPGGVEEG